MDMDDGMDGADAPSAHTSTRRSDDPRRGAPEPAPRRGRPPSGPALAEEVECSEAARLRLRVVLETIAGTLSVDDACAALDIGPSRFHAIRTRFLREAAGLLEPRAPGPAPRGAEETAAELELGRLRRENAELRVRMHAMSVREELAAAMRSDGAAGAKAPGRRAKKKRLRRSR